MDFHFLSNFVFALTLLLLFSVFRPGKPDTSPEKTALLALRSAVGAKSLRWNLSDATPCRWEGVRCDANSTRVTELRLPGAGLSGEIPAGVVGNLTHIRTLSLRFNALSGRLPPDLALCSDLRNLYLQGNEFSGEISGFLFGLRNLVRLNLAGNNFSGEISREFNNLTRLGTLYLESNRLTGSLPDLNLPELVQFNVSFNRLNGSIPAKLRSMPSNSFLGNSLCGGPLGRCSGEVDDSNKKKKKLSGGAIAGIAVGSVLGLLLILLILCVSIRKKRSRRTSKSVDIGLVKPPSESPIPTEKSVEEVKNDNLVNGHGVNAEIVAGGAAAVTGKAVASNGGSKKLVFFANATRFFELEDLLRASAEVLGKGTFGTTYKAVLEGGNEVAVKRLRDVNVTENEFREKIEGVGRFEHENLVSLRAYYYSRDEKLLVFDYLGMGSLSALLHGNRGAGRTPLNWELRSSIALGVARGIQYLHMQGPSVSHGNIKASNILLTETYTPRVSDFGLVHLVGPSSTPNRISGYRAPEVTDLRKVSQKADVYSFGVLLLELLTGKPPTHALMNEEGVDLPRWVQSVVREEWTSEVFDLELLRYQNAEEEMVQLLQLAIDCAAQYPDKRPPMQEVVQQIEELSRTRVLQEQDFVDVVNDDFSR